MGETPSYCISETDEIQQCLGVSVLKGDDNLEHLYDKGYTRLFVAIGSNALREHLANSATQIGYKLVNAISPKAIVSPSASLGVGVAIMAGVVINADTRVEDLAIINTGATVDHDCYIGKAAHIAPQCGLAGHVMVGDQSFLGIGCKVIPHVKIGKQAILGAGSVVISDIHPGVTAVGVPARVI